MSGGLKGLIEERRQCRAQGIRRARSSQLHDKWCHRYVKGTPHFRRNADTVELDEWCDEYCLEMSSPGKLVMSYDTRYELLLLLRPPTAQNNVVVVSSFIAGISVTISALIQQQFHGLGLPAGRRIPVPGHTLSLLVIRRYLRCGSFRRSCRRRLRLT